MKTRMWSYWILAIVSCVASNARSAQMPDLSRLSSGAVYRALGGTGCDVELEVSDVNGEKQVLTTFITGQMIVPCPYAGTTWSFKYDHHDGVYESNAFIEFEPLSDGNFVLRGIPTNRGVVDIKYVK